MPSSLPSILPCRMPTPLPIDSAESSSSSSSSEEDECDEMTIENRTSWCNMEWEIQETNLTHGDVNDWIWAQETNITLMVVGTDSGLAMDKVHTVGGSLELQNVSLTSSSFDLENLNTTNGAINISPISLDASTVEIESVHIEDG